jgi:large subunit ribosomal protein L17
MRHALSGRKFNRGSGHRRALLANLANSLIRHEQIKTTLPKAKDLRPYVEKLITLGKQGSLHDRRNANAILRDNENVSKLIGPLADRYKARQGGYVRIVKAGFRYGDNAPMAIIELVDNNVVAEKRARYDGVNEVGEVDTKAAPAKAAKEYAGETGKKSAKPAKA